jgi:hypothetical protein
VAGKSGNAITILLALFFTVLCGCTALPVTSAGPQLAGCNNPPWVQTMVFFGSLKPAGEVVTGEEWQRFVADEVTPAFPQGFSIMDARGQWLQDGRVIREDAHVLVLAHRNDDDSHARIERLRSVYRSRFAQESVLKVSTPACVQF